jgi:hypothetical protein
MNGVGGIKGAGADKTVLHLPPSGMWFGGGEEGRVPGGPTSKCETKRATVERLRKRVVTLQDVTLVRSIADMENDAPLVKVYGLTLELLRVKIVARGTMGGGQLMSDGAGRLLLKQVDVRGWEVLPDPENIVRKNSVSASVASLLLMRCYVGATRRSLKSSGSS